MAQSSKKAAAVSVQGWMVDVASLIQVICDLTSSGHATIWETVADSGHKDRIGKDPGTEFTRRFQSDFDTVDTSLRDW